MDIAKIRNILKQLLNLLEMHQVNYASVIREIIFQFEQIPDNKLPERFIEEIKSLFGGMGSLNDICICKANGHLVNDEKKANQQLDKFRTVLWNEVNKNYD